MIRQYLLTGVLLLGACTAPPGEREPAERVTDVANMTATSGIPTGRLATTVVPLAYALDLTIVPERTRFEGHVTIDLDIRERLNRFFLHAKDLTVTESLLRGENGDVLLASFRQTNVDGVAEIMLPQTVLPQRASLEIQYSAPFGKRLNGLYRVDDGGQSYAFTQFEPISARQAFPAFDEPAFKTPYSISLSVNSDHVAIASTPEVERIPLENGLVRIRFAKTPPLPTYLIAFAVGPLDVVKAPDIAITPQRNTPLPLRGVATAGKGDRLGHALGTTPGLLMLLEDYFGMAHPYPKLDLLAVPEFAAGAMENVGAITYRESLLLLADDAPVLQRRRHALVHAHEMAHMWFGNLVTMPWWDDIWLNEAFATWMAYKTVAQWNPDHRAELSRLSRLNDAMTEDALSTARQVRQPIETNHDIENAFDGITYSKGGAILSMFERYMGPEQFRKAIRSHIKRFANSNADVDDFIASLAAVGGNQVGEAFRTFLFQPGIPSLNVSLDCTATKPVVTIRQERFRPIGSEAGPSAGWTVPVCLRYGSANEQHENCHLVGPEIETLPLEMDQCPTWLLPNADFAGYFHWIMPVDRYPALLEQAEQHLTAVEQMSISDSVYAALAAGKLSIAEAGKLLASFAGSNRPQVAMAPRQFIEFIRDNLVDRKSTRLGLADYVNRLFGDLPAERVFETSFMQQLTDDSRRLFLVEVAELRARAGDTAIQKQAERAAEHWIAGRTNQVPPGSVELALGLAVTMGGDSIVPSLLDRLKGSRDGQERKTILAALARTTDPLSAEQLRNMTLGNVIRINEIRSFLIEHIKYKPNRSASWKWLQQNFDTLAERLPGRDAGRLPAEMTAGFCDESMVPGIERFLKPRMASRIGGPRNLAKAIEQIKLCARRKAIQRSQADNYF